LPVIAKASYGGVVETEYNRAENLGEHKANETKTKLIPALIPALGGAKDS